MFAHATHTGQATGPALVLLLALLLLLAGMTGCQSSTTQAMTGSFGDDLQFLKGHTETIVLSDATGQAQIAIAPEYQGKVMTSTAGGAGGLSFGWINRELIASGERAAHINVFGGEDRFWLGPEGGQFSIFFQEGALQPGDNFDFELWQTPGPIDWVGWVSVTARRVALVTSQPPTITNLSGFTFDIEINRVIRLLDPPLAEKYLGMEIPEDVNYVAYQSDNRVTNRGGESWTAETGMLSIWILGMFNPSPATTIVVPFKAADVPQEEIVNDAYFGKVPAERLLVEPTRGVLFFSGDGNYRSKIGVAPEYALPTLGSYDAANQVLTLVQFTMPEEPGAYVNSMWEWQDDPFAGDVVNSYNDGPLDDGGQLGPFYELETSSPALALDPGTSGMHIHRTYHLQGPVESLNPIAQRLLGVSLEEIAGALSGAM